MFIDFFKNGLKAYKTLDASEEPSRFLTISYVLALGLIALLATGSHILIMQMTGAQKETAEIVYIAGRQRVTAQQVALHASNFINTSDTKDKALMENAYFSFKLGHDYLVHGYSEGKTGQVKLSPALYSIYFDEPINLHRQSQDYIKLAEAFMKLDSESTREEFFEIYSKLSNTATGALMNGLDLAAQQYQEESLAKINNLKIMQTIVFAVLIMTLLVEALFIFRPLVLHVKQYSQELMHQALRDSLTGLSNRRAFMQSAEVELSRASRHNTPVCMVLCDVDKFKKINDTHGHAAGDEVLKHLSKILTDIFRKEDVIGRIGGEEFAFLLPETTSEQALKLMEKIRLKIQNSPCVIEDETRRPLSLECTASFGVALRHNQAEKLDALLARADAALYEAKENGRNQVKFAKNGKSGKFHIVES